MSATYPSLHPRTRNSVVNCVWALAPWTVFTLSSFYREDLTSISSLSELPPRDPWILSSSLEMHFRRGATSWAERQGPVLPVGWGAPTTESTSLTLSVPFTHSPTPARGREGLSCSRPPHPETESWCSTRTALWL